MCLHVPYSKNLGGKKVWQVRTVGSLAEKSFGELKSICIGNVIEIVKIGKTLANCYLPNPPKFLTTKVFYCTVAIIICKCKSVYLHNNIGVCVYMYVCPALHMNDVCRCV